MTTPNNTSGDFLIDFYIACSGMHPESIKAFVPKLEALLATERNKLLDKLEGELPSAEGRLADEAAGYNDCLEEVHSIIAKLRREG